MVALFQRTVDAFPKGTALDLSRYSRAGSPATCDDDATSPDAPINFAQVSDMRLLPGRNAQPTVAKLGDIWRSWGWKVIERDDFPKPNRFAYAPDGYRLQVESSDPPYTPSVSAISPCMRGVRVDYATLMPTIIESRGAAPR